jgi:hypothetical protein
MSESFKQILITVGAITVCVVVYRVVKNNKNKALALAAGLVHGSPEAKAVVASVESSGATAATLSAAATTDASKTAASTATVEASAAKAFSDSFQAAKTATRGLQSVAYITKLVSDAESKEVGLVVNAFVPKVTQKAIAGGATGPAIGSAAFGAVEAIGKIYLDARLAGKTHEFALATILNYSNNWK